ncbi:MAG TPA: formyltransferase family protein [bacterium]|nr:formyltransferase family protein [bacterium]
MIPKDPLQNKVTLPETEDHSIVIVTMGELRHRRFALRIQQEFGGLVKGWYQIEKPGGASNLIEKIRSRALSDYSAADLRRFYRDNGLRESAKRIISGGSEALSTINELRNRRARQQKAEQDIFKKEVESLKRYAVCSPETVEDPGSDAFLENIRRIDPYFFLSLGGPLYGKKLIETIRGAAINQHAGRAPDYRGSDTVYWTLYHRDLTRLGATVHLMNTGADAGPILKRANPSLCPGDTAEACMARVVALGTELLISCVKDIIDNKTVTVFQQIPGQGMTYTASQLDGRVLRCVARDFKNNWLDNEIERLKGF